MRTKHICVSRHIRIEGAAGTINMFKPSIIFLTILMLLLWIIFVIYVSHFAAQSVTCLTADMCLTADQGAASLIPAWSHTFAEIDHEITQWPFLPSADSKRVVFSYKQKYVHKVLVNRLVKPAQKKSMVR